MMKFFATIFHFNYVCATISISLLFLYDKCGRLPFRVSSSLNMHSFSTIHINIVGYYFVRVIIHVYKATTTMLLILLTTMLRPYIMYSYPCCVRFCQYCLQRLKQGSFQARFDTFFIHLLTDSFN